MLLRGVNVTDVLNVGKTLKNQKSTDRYNIDILYS